MSRLTERAFSISERYLDKDINFKKKKQVPKNKFLLSKADKIIFYNYKISIDIFMYLKKYMIPSKFRSRIGKQYTTI